MYWVEIQYPRERKGDSAKGEPSVKSIPIPIERLVILQFNIGAPHRYTSISRWPLLTPTRWLISLLRDEWGPTFRSVGCQLVHLCSSDIHFGWLCRARTNLLNLVPFLLRSSLCSLFVPIRPRPFFPSL